MSSFPLLYMVIPAMSLLFKILPEDTWESAKKAGKFEGSPLDRSDGFIHLSAADQVRETAARHFAGQAGLVLVAIDSEALGDSLKWEPSRGGALFPHIYGDLPLAAVRWVKPLPMTNGRHQFPEETFA